MQQAQAVRSKRELASSLTLGQKVRHALPFYIFLIPAFVLLCTFVYFPFASAFYYALFEWDIGGAATFIGLENFVTAFTRDSVFLQSLGNMVRLGLAYEITQLTIPLLTAFLVYNLRSHRSRYVYRVMFVLPLAVPGIVIWLLWRFIYADFGLVNELLRLIGLGSLTTGWLSDPGTALWAVLFHQFPFVYPLSFLIFYAGLDSISESVHDAALIDGAGFWTRLFRIDLPLITPQVRTILILSSLFIIQSYEFILVLTGGGPGRVTMVPGLWLYNEAFAFHKMGYASALGIILFILMLGLTIINMRYLRGEAEKDVAK